MAIERKAVGTGRQATEALGGVGLASGIAMMIPDGTLDRGQMAGLTSILAVAVPFLLSILRNVAVQKGWLPKGLGLGIVLIVFLVAPLVACASPGVTKDGTVTYSRAECESDVLILALLVQKYGLDSDDPLDAALVQAGRDRVAERCRMFPELADAASEAG